MMLYEKLSILKKKKLKGYIPYPFIFILLWFSNYYWLNIVIISMGVVYVMAHQGYFFYKKIKLEEVKVGF